MFISQFKTVKFVPNYSAHWIICMEIKIDKSGNIPKPTLTKRRLRVLHIGNIANNAYLNAKILNEAGFDCDVLCYSYYHIMGNPEWEDADFIGDAGSEFLPNWHKVDLRGFHRPKWFAQGSLDTCVHYLTSHHQRNVLQQRLYWHLLEASRFLARQHRFNTFLVKLKWMLIGFPKLGYWRIVELLRMVRGTYPILTHCSNLLKKSLAVGTSENRKDRGTSPVSDFSKAGKVDTRYSAASLSDRNQLYQRLALNFLQIFPNRRDQLLEEDIKLYMGKSYEHRIKKLSSLFEQYDVIHAYGTDPILALFSGIRPYIAFEHGTIRSIPFEESPQGRLTALSYRVADGVIITNCDNKRAAERLHLPDYRFIPHPVNEKWMQPGIGQSLRDDLCRELNADFIIFHPARQHWDAQRHPSWEKGNDILIEGMARAVRETGARLGAVFVEWGQTIQQSRELIARLGIEKNIKWVSPMHSANMARYIDACDLLADQFFLGAFGSTMPRALALGKPAMIYLDEEIHRWCFSEMPPVMNARTPEQVYEGLKRALEHPDWLADLARQGQGWYQKYHSNAVIRERLISFYEDILKKYSTT